MCPGATGARGRRGGRVRSAGAGAPLIDGPSAAPSEVGGGGGRVLVSCALRSTRTGTTTAPYAAQPYSATAGLQPAHRAGRRRTAVRAVVRAVARRRERRRRRRCCLSVFLVRIACRSSVSRQYSGYAVSGGRRRTRLAQRLVRRGRGAGHPADWRVLTVDWRRGRYMRPVKRKGELSIASTLTREEGSRSVASRHGDTREGVGV
ncbi:hypothetical protein CALCODRAFT_110413 [Calocera cornea HHB12733]|uniref:Uncharacterized protein n=1 Tax=Calocera cornea HHB12733 TaxID=1353952 RepID=A0A165D277_9BASI|nr:hypothetical protein CALCODRAFT_110413 [Calocera cornea HHB12733]